jgi:hypothetical protein
MFERELLRQMQLPTGRSITVGEASQVRSLLLDDSGIESIDGIQWFVSVVEIDLSNNPIRDLSPLVGLLELRHLDLGETPLRDLEPLVQLSSLRSLFLQNVRAWVSAEFTAWYLLLEEVDFHVSTDGRLVSIGTSVAPEVVDNDVAGPEQLRIREDNPVIDWASGGGEGSDDAGTPTEMEARTWYDGEFTSSGDSRWYAIPVSAGHLYSIRLDDEFGSGTHTADPVLQLYRSAGTGTPLLPRPVTVDRNGYYWRPVVVEVDWDGFLLIEVVSDNPDRTTFKIGYAASQ